MKRMHRDVYTIIMLIIYTDKSIQSHVILTQSNTNRPELSGYLNDVVSKTHITAFYHTH